MEMISSTPPLGSISKESPNEPANPTESDLDSPESKEENQLVPDYKPRSLKELPSKRNSSHEIDLTQSDDEKNERKVRSPSLTIQLENDNILPEKLSASATFVPAAPSNVSFPSQAAPTMVMPIISDVFSLAPDDEVPQYAYKHLQICNLVLIDLTVLPYMC